MNAEQFVRAELERLGAPPEAIEETIAAGRRELGIIPGDISPQDQESLRAIFQFMIFLARLPGGAEFMKHHGEELKDRIKAKSSQN